MTQNETGPELLLSQWYKPVEEYRNWRMGYQFYFEPVGFGKIEENEQDYAGVIVTFTDLPDSPEVVSRIFDYLDRPRSVLKTIVEQSLSSLGN
jgi:hypothetical protein